MVLLKKRFYLISCLMFITPLVQAELHDRGAGLIYDDVLDVTWLQDVNYAKTSGFDGDGIMSWPQAMAWADTVVYYDSERKKYWDDWRLPQVRPVNGSSYVYDWRYTGNSDYGFNISSPSSELGYMFYVNFKNKGMLDVSGRSNYGEGLADDPLDRNDESMFINIQEAFWTGTDWGGPDAPSWWGAFDFLMGGGAQSRAYKFGSDHFAWLLRDGDVVIPVTCSGFEPPVSSEPIMVKRNRVIPFRATLLNEQTNSILDNLDLTSPPVVNVTYQSGALPAVDVTAGTLSPGSGSSGNEFQFKDGVWSFNLDTKNFSASGIYTVTISLGNSSEYKMDAACTGTFVVSVR